MKGEASFVELLLHVVNGARNASACQWGRLKKGSRNLDRWCFGLEIIVRPYLPPDNAIRYNLTSAFMQPALLKAWHLRAMTPDSITNDVMLSQFSLWSDGV